ncbi:MAG: hypothetical protein E6G18_15560 [Actinobacteria bacterium]|nr:MAG: hypothetical protein E6G18_15560 [Actinomycetota bacterium]
MDANGARELSNRLEAQQHWRQAAAVLRGEQSATDPDALEELREGLRRYGTETQETTMEGRPAVVTHRFCKRLRDERWEVTFEVERVEYFEDPAAQTS